MGKISLKFSTNGEGKDSVRTNGKLLEDTAAVIWFQSRVSMKTCFSQSMYSPDVIHLLGTQSPDAMQRGIELLAQSHSSDLKVIAAFLENVLVTAANYTSYRENIENKVCHQE